MATKKAAKVPEQGVTSITDLLRKNMTPVSDHVRRAREDFEYFLENCIRDRKGNFLILQDSHREMVRVITNRRRALVFMPRGSGKSTLGVAYIAWKVGNDRDLRVFLASKGADLAEERMRELEHILSSREYQEVFGDLIPPPKTLTWTATEKIISGRGDHATHSTFYAVGIGGQAAGHRSDILLADDIIDQKNAMTEVQRGHASAWFWKEVEPVLEPVTGQWIILATPWSHNDLYAEIKENWGEDETADFEFLHVKALYQAKNTEGALEWRSYWPARFPVQEMLNKKRTRPLEFVSQYMCEPIDTTYSFLQKDWLRLVELGSEELPDKEWIRDNWTVYFGIDPTWSGKRQADQFSCVVGAVNPENRRGYIVDAAHAQLSPTDAMTMVQNMADFWRPTLINFEENAAQIFLKEQYIQNTSLPVNGVRAVGPKEERFKAMSVHFTSGRFALAAYRGSDGELHVLPELEGLVYEWVTFPNGETDDILDGLEKMLLAAAYGAEPAEVGVNPSDFSAARIKAQDDGAQRCPACRKPADRIVFDPSGVGLCPSCMLIRMRNTQDNSHNRLRGGVPFGVGMH
jgi:hypothetical protein